MLIEIIGLGNFEFFGQGLWPGQFVVYCPDDQLRPRNRVLVVQKSLGGGLFAYFSDIIPPNEKSVGQAVPVQTSRR